MQVYVAGDQGLLTGEVDNEKMECFLGVPRFNHAFWFGESIFLQSVFEVARNYFWS